MRPGGKCCREGTPDYDKQSQKTRNFICNGDDRIPACPRNPAQFDDWFFHIQEIALLQTAGYPFQKSDLSEDEWIGLGIYNAFHEDWKSVGYQKQELIPEPKKLEEKSNGQATRNWK